MSNCSGATPRMSLTPALLTSTSILPCSAIAVSTTCTTSASTDTSPVTTVTLLPFSRHDGGDAVEQLGSIAPSGRGRRRPAANAWANPSPKPYDAPVMSTVLPLKSNMGRQRSRRARTRSAARTDQSAARIPFAMRGDVLRGVRPPVTAAHLERPRNRRSRPHGSRRRTRARRTRRHPARTGSRGSP